MILLQIFELDSAKNIAVDGKRTLDEEEKLNAVRLLAKKNFNAVQFSSDVHEMAVDVRTTLSNLSLLY